MIKAHTINGACRANITLSLMLKSSESWLTQGMDDSGWHSTTSWPTRNRGVYLCVSGALGESSICNVTIVCRLDRPTLGGWEQREGHIVFIHLRMLSLLTLEIIQADTG